MGLLFTILLIAAETCAGADGGRASGLKVRNHKLWLGVVLGRPLTRDFTPMVLCTICVGPIPSRRANFRSAAGLSVETEVSNRVSVEANVLYRRLHFDTGPEVVVTWEVPVLAKYRLSDPKKPVSLFVEGGPSFRLAGNLNDSNPSHSGITGGLGVHIRAGWLRVAPGLRYTRWAADTPARFFPPPITKRDQVELLVGLSF